MPFCPSNTSQCSDNTCLCYENHTSCAAHALHIGDRIKNINRGDKLGYIYNINPLKSKRSIIILYDDEEKEAIFGYRVCEYIVLTGDPRDLSRIDPRLN